MNIPEIQTTKKPSFLTIAALAILVISALLSLGGSLLMLLAGIFSATITLPTGGDLNLFSTLSATTMLAVFGCLSIPGIVFLVQKLSRNYQPKPSEEEDPYRHVPFSRMMPPTVALGITALLLLVVYLLSSRFEWVRWLLPFLQVPAVIVPIFWVYQYSTRKSFQRPTKRSWIALGLNLTIQPALALALELMVVIAMLVPITLWIVSNPVLMQQAVDFFARFQEMSFLTAEELEAQVGTWLSNPWVIVLIQLFVAVLVPLLEELIKPILVWRWVKRPLTPLDGFWLGLIGGAAFALYENFGNLGSMSMVNDWYFLLLARVGTTFVHMGTTALMGWGLMKTFRDHKWLRALAVYAIVVLLHGAWNFFTLLLGFSTFPMETPPDMFQLSVIALPVLILIGIASAAIVAFGAGRIQVSEQITSPVMEEPTL